MASGHIFHANFSIREAHLGQPPLQQISNGNVGILPNIRTPGYSHWRKQKTEESPLFPKKKNTLRISHRNIYDDLRMRISLT
jgi:hypothetical protein